MAATRRSSVVYQVLARPRLVAGADFKFVAINVCLAAIVCIIIHFWWYLIGMYVIHKVLQAIARNDPLSRVIFITYSKQRDRYDPWPRENAVRGLRPANFGRGAAQ
ncbi:MAG: hypothetical protein EPN36_14165 [Rhodanobacteraceae bacterium]|nr:MAG: hypothetical protein EPN36_14165 [Rhodanobacteraceae bacterium]